MTTGQKLSAGAMLQILGEQLSDAELARVFPHLPGDEVRAVLSDAARVVAAGVESSPVPKAAARQQPLFLQETVEDAPAELAHVGPLTLYADGAARGNPGPAGAGFVVLDGDGAELVGRGVYLGECTNNVAEYQALILGLEEVRKLGGRELAIFLDSELIVRQLTGRYQVKNAKLKPLYTRVRTLLAGLDSWQVRHVPRHKNSRADELANQGVDSRGTLG